MTHTRHNSRATAHDDMQVTPSRLETITGAACELSSEPYMARESDFGGYGENHITGTSFFY